MSHEAVVAKMHPHSMMLPQTCFAIEMGLAGLTVPSFFQKNDNLELEAKSCIFDLPHQTIMLQLA